MSKISLIEAPSILGLRPTGVDELPTALKAAGVLVGLDVENVGRVEPETAYNPQRNRETHYLNAPGIKAYSPLLADKVSEIVKAGNFPLVLGGDCSILIGDMLALRRMGRYGLFFVDGHADFYQSEASETGEVADMDLAVVTGHNNDALTNIEGLKPLVREEDVVLFGDRDQAEAAEADSQNVRETAIHAYNLQQVQEMGAAETAKRALSQLSEQLEGIWLHLDADVLDYAIMPAVEYRLDGGLSLEMLTETLQTVLASGRVVGMEITIYNPRFDPLGEYGRGLAAAVNEALRAHFTSNSAITSVGQPTT